MRASDNMKRQSGATDRDAHSECPAGFVPKFYAYRIDRSGITKKLYIYPPYPGQSTANERVTLGAEQTEALSLALGSPAFAALDSERFTLYEISLRESGRSKGVSFNFIDRRDCEYLSAKEVFCFLHGFDANPLVSATQRMEGCIFAGRPAYNPTWMFGLLFDRDALAAAKSYIRFDPENALNRPDRRDIISNIVRSHGASGDLGDELLRVAGALEDCGLVFRFIGIDCSADGLLRYKLYFRSNGGEDCAALREWLLCALTDPDYKEGAEEMFGRHGSGMWGIGLSLGDFEGITGFQPYFLP